MNRFNLNKPIIAVAPMMDCTDRHDRYFLRLIAADVQLYTEMITAQAIRHGDWARLLKFHPSEKYLALQVGGNCPEELAHAARVAEDLGYNEINLNVGCPSSRVKSGEFGACLMLKPALVAECVRAMIKAVQIPVTVKCRTGVDAQDDYASLYQFVKMISETGCQTFIVHARKAWLQGLSPRENREIPPLEYEKVYQLKRDFPTLNFIINGGIKSVEQVEVQLANVDGVMIGREAYAKPYFLAEIQKRFFSNQNVLTRKLVVAKYIPYVDEQIANGVKLSSISRHILGIFHGLPGAGHWRRYISEYAHKHNSSQVIWDALQLVHED